MQEHPEDLQQAEPDNIVINPRHGTEHHNITKRISVFEGTSEYRPADAGQDLWPFRGAESTRKAAKGDQGAEDEAHRRPYHREDQGKKAGLSQDAQKIMRVVEAIGYIIMIGILLGVILTAVWIIFIALRGDPDFEDEHDAEIYEHDYWKNKNKKA